MAEPLKIFYAHKPFVITQRWGNPNPIYKAAGFSFSQHNGTDSITGTKNINGSDDNHFPVYCPVENFTVYQVDYASAGGGHELWLLSNAPLQMNDKVRYAYMPLCHGKKILVKAGDQPKLGQLLMISDSTGFSTGQHLHEGLYRVQWDGRSFIHDATDDQNDAGGSYDPAQFFTGEYAIDKAALSTLIANNFLYFTYLMGMA